MSCDCGYSWCIDCGRDEQPAPAAPPREPEGDAEDIRRLSALVYDLASARHYADKGPAHKGPFDACESPRCRTISSYLRALATPSAPTGGDGCGTHKARPDPAREAASGACVRELLVQPLTSAPVGANWPAEHAPTSVEYPIAAAERDEAEAECARLREALDAARRGRDAERERADRAEQERGSWRRTAEKLTAERGAAEARMRELTAALEEIAAAIDGTAMCLDRIDDIARSALAEPPKETP